MTPGTSSARQFLSTGIWRGELTRRLGAKNPLRFFAPPVLVVNLVVALIVALLQVTGVLAARRAGSRRSSTSGRWPTSARSRWRRSRAKAHSRPAPLRRRAGDDAHLLGRRFHRRHPPWRRRLRRHVPPTPRVRAFACRWIRRLARGPRFGPSDDLGRPYQSSETTYECASQVHDGRGGSIRRRFRGWNRPPPDAAQGRESLGGALRLTRDLVN